MAFESSHLLIGELALREDQYASAAKRLAVFDALIPRLDAVPGVRGVSPVVTVPFSVGWDGRPVVEGQSAEDAFRNLMLNMDLVGPDYLTTFGIPLLQGAGSRRQTMPARRRSWRSVSRRLASTGRTGIRSASP